MSANTQPHADRDARHRAEADFSTPILLEAGAGTGKTAVLVARLVRWCTGPGWERAASRETEADIAARAARVLRGCVAITFTEASAGEMAQRLREALAALAEGRIPLGMVPEGLEDARPRAAALLASFEHFFVGTIHAFCRRILLGAPLAARLHPEFLVDADGSLARSVVREVIEQGLARAFAEGADPDWRRIATHGVGPKELEQALLTVLAADDGPRRLADDREDPGPAFAESFRSACRELVAAAEGLPGSVAAALVAAARQGAQPDADVLASRGEGWEPRFVTRLSAWSRARWTRSEERALGGDASQLARAAAALLPRVRALRSYDPERFHATRRVLATLAAEAAERLRARGVVTFDALLGETRSLLATRADIRRHWQGRLEQILVDEFQDTDPVQCEILRYLAFDSAGGERPGLFVVGDPKQSIYGFRSADLRAYESFAEELRSRGGARLALTVNFRSVPGVLDEVERIVGAVMRAEAGRQPAFERLLPARKESEAGSVAHWVLWDENDRPPRVDEAARIEARAVAADVARAHSEGTSWSEIALLFRTGGDLDVYCDALRDRGVPYQVARETAGVPRREIRDALALLRCAIGSEDRFALVTWLRSAWVGVPDASLEALLRAGLPALVRTLRAWDTDTERRVEALLREAAGDSLPDWAHSLRFALSALAHVREKAEREPPAPWLDRLRRVFVLDAMTAGWSQGSHRVEQLSRVFALVEEGLGESSRTPLAVIDEVERILTRPDDVEAEAVLPADGNAVTLSTIHAAKGLDWERVYLLRTHRGIRNAPPETRLSRPGEPPGMRFAGVANLPDWELAEIRDANEAAEQVRLLYVAMTRAKNDLVLSGIWPKDRASDLRFARTTADLIAMGDVPDHEELEARRDSGARSDAEPGRTFAFPALWRPEGGSSKPPPAPVSSASLDAWRTEYARVLARRREASLREERPWVGIASERAELDETPALKKPMTSVASLSRPEALAVGEAVHAALEEIRSVADPRDARTALVRTARHNLEANLPAESIRAARAEVEAILEGFIEGPLFARLEALLPNVIARELPIIAPSTPDDPALAAIAGAIDLVYRDASGRIVIADFKTDRVEPGTESLAGESYRRQGDIYVRAVREALNLPDSPPFELWWLRTGTVTRLSAETGRVAASQLDLFAS